MSTSEFEQRIRIPLNDGIKNLIVLQKYIILMPRLINKAIMCNKVRIIFFSLCMLLFCTVVLVAADNTICFAANPEKQGGYILEITRQACLHAGYDFKVEYMPIARALMQMEKGSSEAMLGVQYTDERAKSIGYSHLVSESDMVFFVLKDSGIQYKELQDLTRYRIGIIRGAAYSPEFDSLIFSKKELVADFHQNIRMLAMDRIDIFLEKKKVVLNSLDTEFPLYKHRIIFLEKPFKIMRFYAGFSKKIPGWEKRRDDFNRGLEEIIKDGTVERILLQYPHE